MTHVSRIAMTDRSAAMTPDASLGVFTPAGCLRATTA